MSDDMLQTLTWVGIAAGVLVLFGALEILFRFLSVRFGTPQGVEARRRGGSWSPEPRTERPGAPRRAAE